MLTAKSPLSQKNLPTKPMTVHPSVVPHVIGSGYQRLELLLVGFATVFITFLWVGVFSAVLKDQAIRVPFAGNGAVAALTRNVADSVGVMAKGILDSGGMARDTIVYQFTAIWESSCITQQVCGGNLQAISQKTSSLGAIVDNIALNSELFITFMRDASSFRIAEAGVRLSQLVLPGTVYATGVLGEKIVSPDAALQKGVSEYFQYVDSMTFGLVTAISPELTQDAH